MENSLKTLYNLSESINLLKEERNVIYNPITFSTLFCGIPNVYSGLNLPIVLMETFPSFLDNSVAGIGSHVVIDARKLENVFDLDRKQIYEGSNGTIFIYNYTPPNALSKLDKGIFLPPRIAFEESKDMHHIFFKASEILVDQFPITDQMTKLTLTNRITELQVNAFIQGRSIGEIRDLNELLEPIENISPLIEEEERF